MDSKLTFKKPWIMQRADPYVYKHTDGIYYFTATVPEYDRICIRCANSLSKLPEASEKEIWHKHWTGVMGHFVWAPEIHYLFGKWYIYFAAGEAEPDRIWEIRPYVLECQGKDPMNDPWIEKGKLVCHPEDEFSFRAFSLDATVFEVNNEWYIIWAEKVSVGKQISNLYIGRLKNAYTLDTVQVLLTTPDYDWARPNFWVNEGPAVLQRDGKIFVTFSASDTSSAYCMGMLTADSRSDLLDPKSWDKSRYPVFKTSAENKIYGPGHNSFTVDDEGNDILVFHAREYEDIGQGDPLNNPDRHAMLLPVTWENGIPVFRC